MCMFIYAIFLCLVVYAVDACVLGAGGIGIFFPKSYQPLFLYIIAEFCDSPLLSIIPIETLEAAGLLSGVGSHP